MPRHKIPSIAERGGLRVYLTELGIDYNLFKSLHSSIGNRYGAIADALTKQAGLKKRLRPDRIKRWCQVDDQEEETNQHDSSKTN